MNCTKCSDTTFTKSVTKLERTGRWQMYQRTKCGHRRKGGMFKMSELIEVKCKTCGKNIAILEEYKKDELFCTLMCMDIAKGGKNNAQV